MKMFAASEVAWKCMHVIQPCYGVLANRHIGNSSMCPACNIHGYKAQAVSL